MYLLVFVFLMLSIIGLYTQIYALQASQMLAKQTAIGKTMLAWHGGALRYARENAGLLGSTSTTATGCLLTAAVTPPGSLTACSSLLAVTSTALPVGYSTNYRWYSVVYAPPGFGTHVLTYAPPVTAGNANSMITQPAIGYTPSEILQQIRTSDAPMTVYGVVQGANFVTPDAGITPLPSWTVPSSCGGCVPAGSVGFISPL